MTDKAEFVDEIIRDVAELPDRNSPEDWPQAMLVTADELREIVLRHASPKFEAGDAVEVAVQAHELAYDTERYRGATSQHAERAAMRAALQAAFPALVARCQELERQSVEDHNVMTQCRVDVARLEAEVERLKGAK